MSFLQIYCDGRYSKKNCDLDIANYYNSELNSEITLINKIV
jgi:hypothetical protein